MRVTSASAAETKSDQTSRAAPGRPTYFPVMSPPLPSLSLQFMQNQLLHSPVRDLANIELVRIAAIDLVNRAEFFQQLPRFAEFTQDAAVQLHLVDLAVVHIGRAVGIGTEEILMRSRRDADSPWRADIDVLRLEFAVIVEHLNAPVAAIAHVDIAWRICRDGVRGIELAGRRASRSPRLDEDAVAVELGHTRIAVAVGNENVPGRVPGDVRRPV